MAPPTPVPEAPPVETPSLILGGTTRRKTRASPCPASRWPVGCYLWLKQMERECRDLPKEEGREHLLVTRRLLVRRQIDDSWGTSGELVRYAAGYLEDLAEGGLRERDIDLIGYHPEIAKIRARICKLADTVWPVLMVGERGTGKGHLMRAIAKSTGEAPLVVVLAGMPEDLADPELFGHTKGAFTGAHKARDGIILTAHRSRSPLFLDDVGECPPAVQAKLLTVLDDGVFRPIGSDEVLTVGRGPERRFRIYSASQPEPLRKLRPDLRDRLATIMVHIPPLRERGIDILLLADHFLREAGAAARTAAKSLSDEARLVLLEQDWPGNVRQLSSVMVRADYEAGGRAILDAAAVRASLRAEPDTGRGPSDPLPEDDPRLARFPTMGEMTDRHLREALDRTGDNVSAAAKLLGVHRSTVYEWLRRQRRAEPGVGNPDR